MPRKRYTQKGLQSTVHNAQERHRRLERERVELLFYAAVQTSSARRIYRPEPATGAGGRSCACERQGIGPPLREEPRCEANGRSNECLNAP